MKLDVRRAFLGLFVGSLGLCFLSGYFGLIQMTITGIQGIGQAAAGFTFVLAGGWVFYRAVIPPEWSTLPAYVWTRYILVSLVLALFALTFLWGAWSEGNLIFIAAGLLPLLAAVWFIVFKFPTSDQPK